MVISPSGLPIVAYRVAVNNFKTTVLSFNGSNWIALGGGGISVGAASFQSLAIGTAGQLVVAYQDQAIPSVNTTVLSFDGINWKTLGNAGIGADQAYSQSLAMGSSGLPVVAYNDRTNGGTTILSFTGSSWTNLGGVSIGYTNTADYQSLVISPSGMPFVAYSDQSNGSKTAVLSFNNDNNWSNVGNQSISIGQSSYQSLVFNPISNEPYLAYSGVSGALYVQRFGKYPQTISNFSQIHDVTLPGINTFILVSTTTSGLQVSYSVSGVATLIDNHTLSFTGLTGLVSVTAYQEGDANYLAASSVTQTLHVFNSFSSALTEEESNKAIYIFPNPSESGDFQILGTAMQGIEVSDVFGRQIDIGTTLLGGKTNTQVDISAYNKGLYLFRLFKGKTVINTKVVHQ